MKRCNHEAAQLLPWLVAGTLDLQESALVQSHLRECSICAEDEQYERRVRALMHKELPVEHVPQPGLQKLLSRLDEFENKAALAPASRPRPAVLRWLVAAVVVQAVGLGVLCAVLWNRLDSNLYAPRFVTLSSTQPHNDRAAKVRVVFAPETTLREMQALLAAVPATLVEGPSEAGVYTLSLTGKPKSTDEALARLRTDARVLFAEPQGY